jgi:hypothetical protein
MSEAISVVGRARDLSELMREHDPEGIVAQRLDDAYDPRIRWLKVKQIVDAKAQFRSLAEPWADTGTSTGRLMLAVLGGLADVERDLIAPAPPKAAAGRSSADSAWAGNRY